MAVSFVERMTRQVLDVFNKPAWFAGNVMRSLLSVSASPVGKTLVDSAPGPVGPYAQIGIDTMQEIVENGPTKMRVRVGTAGEIKHHINRELALSRAAPPWATERLNKMIETFCQHMETASQEALMILHQPSSEKSNSGSAMVVSALTGSHKVMATYEDMNDWVVEQITHATQAFRVYLYAAIGTMRDKPDQAALILENLYPRLWLVKQQPIGPTNPDELLPTPHLEQEFNAWTDGMRFPRFWERVVHSARPKILLALQLQGVRVWQSMDEYGRVQNKKPDSGAMSRHEVLVQQMSSLFGPFSQEQQVAVSDLVLRMHEEFLRRLTKDIFEDHISKHECLSRFQYFRDELILRTVPAYLKDFNRGS